MRRFPCQGGLHLSITKDSNCVIISLKHAIPHDLYDTSLPDHWKSYIEDHTKTETLGQVSNVTMMQCAHSNSMVILRSGVTSFSMKLVINWLTKSRSHSEQNRLWLESTCIQLDKSSKNSVPLFYFFPSPFVPGSLEYIEP